MMRACPEIGIKEKKALRKTKTIKTIKAGICLWVKQRRIKMKKKKRENIFCL